MGLSGNEKITPERAVKILKKVRLEVTARQAKSINVIKRVVNELKEENPFRTEKEMLEK